VADNPLAVHYSRFRVSERLLLTGHSHQAWPDVGFDAQQQAWLDAAELVDDKWERAAAKAAEVRLGYARLLEDRPDNIALGQNTLELVARWLSAFPLPARPRIVTTDGEFHTIRGLVDRLETAGLEIVRVASRPAEALADRLKAAVDSRTSCVMVSSVLFETAEIVPRLDEVAGRCRLHGAGLLIDAYHQINVVPFTVSPAFADVFVTGGGYKYCQLGEGNAFLRVPPGTGLRPILTGWFAEFAALEGGAVAGSPRQPTGATTFAGATYDPASHYRAAAVFAFHQAQSLDPYRLRQVSQRQVSLLRSRFESIDAPAEVAFVEPMPEERRAGFLAIRAPEAVRLARRLRERGVHADARGTVLRLGPAPYLRDDQLTDAIDALAEVLRDR
jgi:kynureninase